MTEMVLDIQSLPERIFAKISTQKVKYFEDNGTITLTPFFENKPRFDHLRGMFSGNGTVVDEFLKEKHKEIELEA